MRRMAIVVVTIGTLFFGGILFGVLTELWGKGMVEFAWFVVLVAFFTYLALSAWGSVL